MFNKKISLFTCAIAVLIACCVTFVAVTSVLSTKHKAEINSIRQDTSKYSQYADFINDVGANGDKYTKLALLIDMIESTYIRDFDSDEMWNNVYRSLAISIGDAYSQYLTADEYAALLDSGDGDFVGIGIHASYDVDTEGIYIFGVMPDSPAQKADIQKGDTIVAIDGIEATKDNYYKMLDAARGEAGTYVSLTILRGEERLEYKVKRAAVASENVMYEKLDDSIAYIRILSFADDTVSDEFAKAIIKAQSEGCKKYVFDVRNNTGGYLEQICGVLDLLLPEGPIINIVDAGGNVTSRDSDANCIAIEKAAVLCNDKTASAAELFTAALRDYDIAEVVGVTTFGKGTMQTTKLLSDGSAIKISTAFYNPPLNVSYDGIGIIPDHEIELDEKWQSRFYKMPQSEDDQLKKALDVIK